MTQKQELLSLWTITLRGRLQKENIRTQINYRVISGTSTKSHHTEKSPYTTEIHGMNQK
jgi:hypothetical protein